MMLKMILLSRREFIIIHLLFTFARSAPLDDSEAVRPTCPAGTHLDFPSESRCIRCQAGASFTAEPNRYPECRRCTYCSGGKRQTAACSETSDTICSCSVGFYENIDQKCSPLAASKLLSDAVISTPPIEQSQLTKSTTETMSTASISLPLPWITEITGLVAAVLGVSGTLLLLLLIILVVICCPGQHEKRMNSLAGKLRNFQKNYCGNAVVRRCGDATENKYEQADSSDTILPQEQKQVAKASKKEPKKRSSYDLAVDELSDEIRERDSLLSGQHSHSSNNTGSTLPSSISAGSVRISTIV